MPATDRDWARGYAKQALSDLDAREKLVRADAHKCHRLHFVQMAAEKACKAHLTIANGHDNVRRTHAYVARNLPIIARHFYAVINDDNRISHWEIAEIRRLAREIEVLAPACDDGNVREDNTEYPWLDGAGNVRVPCEYGFPNIDDHSRAIVRLIRLIRAAAETHAQHDVA
jgi:hypothetical protein